MAIAFANLGVSAAPDFASQTAATSFATASWAPPTSGLILLSIYSVKVGGSDIPTVSGNSLTWVEIETILNGNWRLTLFAANASGSTTGATTVSYGGNSQLRCLASFAQATGVDLTGGVTAAFVQSLSEVDASTTTPSITLASAGHADNRPYAAFTHGFSPAIAPRTNWTEFDELNVSDGGILETQYRADAFETTASATGNETSWEGIAVELKAETAISVSPTGIVSAEAVGTASSQLVVGAIGVLSAEDWGEANYADERFTYADSALDYEGHAALIDVVLQVQPAGIASAEAFGTTEVVSAGAPTITPSGIASEEAFGTSALSFVVQPVAILSEEVFGTASVGLVVVPSGIPSDEAVGTPALIVQIQPSGVASAEAFGTPLVGTVIAVSGIPSGEAVGAPSVRVVVAPTAIPTGEAFGTPAVSGPGTISVQGIASGEAIGTLSLVAVIAPTGIVSGEAVGTPTVSLVQLLVVGIPSAEAFGTAQIVWVVQSTGVSSGEAFGTAQVVLLGPGQPGRIPLEGTHDPRISLNGTHAPRKTLTGKHRPRKALVGNSGLE